MKTPAARVRLTYCAALWISLADRWAEELISGDSLQRPAQTRRLCFSWGGVHNQGYQRRWNVTGIYYQREKTPPTVRGANVHRHSLNWVSFKLTAREGPQTSKSNHSLFIRLARLEDWNREYRWISPCKICPERWFWSRRHLEIEAIWYLGPLSLSVVLLRAVPLSAQALCGIYLSHEWQCPPTPRCHSHFHRLLFQAQRFSPAQQALQFCHLHKLNTCLRCW